MTEDEKADQILELQIELEAIDSEGDWHDPAEAAELVERHRKAKAELAALQV